MKRRLAAILAADIVGYSRLMAADETGTIGRVNALYQGHVNISHRAAVMAVDAGALPDEDVHTDGFLVGQGTTAIHEPIKA